MTEEKIFQILLPKHYDYPKLHPEAAATAANSFADIIYDTLKLKSTLPTTKRLNVLKFLRTLESNSGSHLNINKKNYMTFIECLEGGFTVTNDFEDLLYAVRTELEQQLPTNICTEIQEFYKKKNEQHQRKIKRLELIKKYDQEALDKANFSTRITRHISYYETSDNIIKSLFDGASTYEGDKIQRLEDFSAIEYRNKQIKFAYSLVYLQQWSTLMKVLERLQKYKTVTSVEINFLMYLSENEHFSEFLVKNFIFIFEKLVIDLCTEIIQVEGDFFETLFDKRFVIIKKLCELESFKLKLTHLLYELYSYSFCNGNLLKFMDFLM